MNITYSQYAAYVSLLNANMSAGMDLGACTTEALDESGAGSHMDDILALGSATTLVEFLKSNKADALADADMWNDTIANAVKIVDALDLPDYILDEVNANEDVVLIRQLLETGIEAVL